MHKQIRTPKGRVKDLESLLSRLAIESERNDGIRTYQARRMPDPLFPQDAPVQIFLGAAPGQYNIPTQEMLEVIARNAPGDHGLILDLNTSDENWPRLEVFWNILFDRMKAEGYFDDEEPVLSRRIPFGG